MQVTLRVPQFSEAALFAALHQQCWREAYSAIVPRGVLDAADLGAHIERWQALLQERDRYVVGAYVGGEPAGFINAGPPRENLYEGEDGHVAAIYVLEAHYRKGIGRQLMASAARWWLAQGGTALGLTALADNQAARRFYEALGGKMVKTGIYFWHGFALPDVVYHFDNLAGLAAA